MRHHISKVANCKVIPGESLTTWWCLLDEARSREFASAIGDKCVDTKGVSVQEYWNKIQAANLSAAKALLGVSKEGRKCGKETWWWNNIFQLGSDHLQPLYEKLESTEGQKLIYKLARSKIKAAQDISKYRRVKDLGDDLLCEDLAVKERLRSYFNELLNKQHKAVQPRDLPRN
ncbi:unnamed protein product [Arctia plantaginis]|uniref:Uncharacterized protein n=1 Tax=Arctia plantaginis TaxID=874455 RepID=A0A8S0Z1H3_ARCPL|nr:unnamed protein product [Arctia plantaginis]